MTVKPMELATLGNGQAIDLTAIPQLSIKTFGHALIQRTREGMRVVSYFAAADNRDDAINLFAVLADDVHNELSVVRTTVEGDHFPSLTPQCLQVHLFEREIAEQFALTPVGHPWCKPVRHHASWRNDHDVWAREVNAPITPDDGPFYRVEGDQIHEVAVGPVHAGVIEPGHFRFQCHGEQVFHLEIGLGYQHRGVEQAMIGGPNRRSIHYAQTVAGDTTIGHTIAYCQTVEALCSCQSSARAESLRGIALELERLANHVGDLGALANDIGFLPIASTFGRIRGEFLNMMAMLCGSRFGRGFVRPGGVGFDVEPTRVKALIERLDIAEMDLRQTAKLLWDTPSVRVRFENTGVLPQEIAKELGTVGPAARASGLGRDVRHDQPWGIYRFAHIPVVTWTRGDAFARAYVRWLEIDQSLIFIREQLRSLPADGIAVQPPPLAPHRLAVSLVEGWRGEICHVAMTDHQGNFSRYKIVDPSFHNWMGLAHAMRCQEISDFPLCNKSFNLSYCGHDL